MAEAFVLLQQLRRRLQDPVGPEALQLSGEVAFASAPQYYVLKPGAVQWSQFCEWLWELLLEAYVVPVPTVHSTILNST